MATNESLHAILDKAYEQMPLKDLVKQSPGVFAGLSDQKAELLKQALGVATIEDLATSKFVRWAQALVALAEYEKLEPAKPAADKVAKA